MNYPEIKSIPKLPSLAIVFCQPEMALVGQNHQQLEKSGLEFITGAVSYEKQGRAQIETNNYGAVELYVEKSTRKLLGAELFCPEAEHFAHMLVWLIGEE